jgi:hypothetical protein
MCNSIQFAALGCLVGQMTYAEEKMHEVKKTAWTDEKNLRHHGNGFEGWQYEGLNISQRHSTDSS